MRLILIPIVDPENTEDATSSPTTIVKPKLNISNTGPPKKNLDFVNIDELHNPDKYMIAREELRSMIPYSG
jgi:hypothetical protein